MTLKIIGFTDSVTECECCGKSELKGTYCIEIDGVELYYGSTCAFKSHGISKEEQKEMKDKFTREQKNKALYEMYIAPLVEYRDALLKSRRDDYINSGYTGKVEDMLAFDQKQYRNCEDACNSKINSVAKKYKITID